MSEMVIKSEPVDPTEEEEEGLFDQIVTKEELDQGSNDLIEPKKEPQDTNVITSDLIESNKRSNVLIKPKKEPQDEIALTEPRSLRSKKRPIGLLEPKKEPQDDLIKRMRTQRVTVDLVRLKVVTPNNIVDLIEPKEEPLDTPSTSNDPKSTLNKQKSTSEDPMEPLVVLKEEEDSSEPEEQLMDISSDFISQFEEDPLSLENVEKEIRQEKTYFQCGICFFQTFTERSLTSHVNKTHKVGNYFVCDHCGFFVAKVQELTAHVECVHPLVKRAWKTRETLKQMEKQSLQTQKTTFDIHVTQPGPSQQPIKIKPKQPIRIQPRPSYQAPLPIQTVQPIVVQPYPMPIQKDVPVIRSVNLVDTFSTLVTPNDNPVDSYSALMTPNETKEVPPGPRMRKQKHEQLREEEPIRKQQNQPTSTQQGQPTSLTKYPKIMPKEPGAPFKCDLCPYEGQKKAYLSIHKVHEHKLGCYFVCDKCGFFAEIAEDLGKHMEQEHNLANTPVDQCFKTFYTKYRQMHSCSFCDFKTNQKENLRDHIKYRHSNIIKCQLCDFSSGFPEALTRHIKNVHDSGKDTKCDYCNFRTRFLSDLRAHMKTHYREYKCSNCSFVAEDRKLLVKHIIDFRH